ncbi:MAG: segregation/condensation protein A [Candidatus Obscuribacterales bacterium]|nr:segregation/condensation protein A [Candidatus Obscuribacterales bacterium]
MVEAYPTGFPEEGLPPIGPEITQGEFQTPTVEAPSKGYAAVGGIELLVEMAAKGEIDPKNIDIIDVTDKFLRAIAAAPKENLRQSGKTLFHASVLLRMKAEALLVDNLDDLSGGDDFLDFDEEGGIIYDANNQPVARQITLADLEKALVRRANNKQMRQRKVTLEQLIEALREAEHIEKARATKERKPAIDLEGQHEVNDFDDILELAHDEDIEVVIARIEQILVKHFISEDTLPLVHLIRAMGERGDWVDAFLAVLFLSNAGKITLEQEQFYGPLFLVRPGERQSSADNDGEAQPEALEA